jgi:hypothetical protein
MYNFSELKTEVARLVQRSGDTDYLTKIGTWLNLSLEFLYNSYDYFQELQDVHNFTTVASTESYFMPSRFNKPLRILDLTNKRQLHILTEEEYVDGNLAAIADATTVTVPDKARIYGVDGVIRQISTSGDTVKALSSKSTDTGSVKVRVEGYLDSALTILGYEDITLNTTDSTTAVAGTTTFYKIRHVSKSGDTNGYVTLQDSSSNVLVNLGQKERVAHHKVLKLGLIPSQANSMRILFKRTFTKMVDDNDYPFVEADGFLIQEAMGYAVSEEKDMLERAQAIWGKSKESWRLLLSNQNSKLGPSYFNRLESSLLQAHRS